jgi:glycosyltransferase involved in cell wall biosynthesis
MFHLLFLAAAIDENVVDFNILIGLYPLPIIRRLMSVLPVKYRSKIYDRAQNIDKKRIRIHLLSEILAQLSSFSGKLGCPLKIRNYAISLVYKSFSSIAARHLDYFKPIIYHYRCSFGLSSLEIARQVNAIKLCDHSIAHPAHIQYLVSNDGSFPSEGISSSQCYDKIHFQYMHSDLESADHIVVNSDFVKTSLLRAGHPESSITVVELGVDKKIIDFSLRYYSQAEKRPASTLLYAGGWIKRKGVHTLAKTMEMFDGKAELIVAGAEIETVTKFCTQSNISANSIKPLGYLSRDQLAAEMIKAQIFVFPSLCEGYAKVIQEAMVCGCYIIATYNSGFSLCSGAHGTIVRPNDQIELRDAIQDAISNPNLSELGDSNRTLALELYSPRRYAENMENLYLKLAQKRSAKGC